MTFKNLLSTGRPEASQVTLDDWLDVLWLDLTDLADQVNTHDLTWAVGEVGDRWATNYVMACKGKGFDMNRFK